MFIISHHKKSLSQIAKQVKLTYIKEKDFFQFYGVLFFLVFGNGSGIIASQKTVLSGHQG